jgi:hypothetical protein
MTKAVFDTLDRQGFEVAARLAQANSTEHDFPHNELLLYEVIQRHAACRQVPPGLTEKPTCGPGLLQRLDTNHGLAWDGPGPVPRVYGLKAEALA